MVLTTSNNRDAVAPLGSLSQCCAMLLVKKKILMSSLSLEAAVLWPLPLVTLSDVTEKASAPLSL